MGLSSITNSKLPQVLLVNDTGRAVPPYSDVIWTGLELQVVDSVEQAGRVLHERPFVMVLVVSGASAGAAKIIGRLKGDHPSVPMLAQTPEPSSEGVIEAFHAGAFDYLIEPVGFERIEQQVDTVLEKRTLGARRSRLETELRSERKKVVALEEKIHQTDPFESVIGSSPTIRRLVETVREVAGTDSTVMITGESGTGKGLMARSIHLASSRQSGPFVMANCAVYSKGLLHSELFGHERGAFTGASRLKKGRFELAAGGTVFLDEVGDIGQETQMLLLRILQERTYERVGGEITMGADVRLIAATNKDLEQAMAEGAFRADLYYRLNVIPIRMPALRDHREDIPALAQHFLSRYSGRHGKLADSFHPAAMERLVAYRWPGNIRELENMIERIVVLCRSEEITISDLPEPFQGQNKAAVPRVRGTLEEIEAARIAEALREAGGNKKLAARKLGIHRSTLYKKIERLGLNSRKSGHDASDTSTQVSNY